MVAQPGVGTAPLASVQRFRAAFFCVSGAISTALKALFVLILALIGTVLIKKWKVLHLKSGDITDSSKLLNPQQPERKMCQNSWGRSCCSHEAELVPLC